MGLLFVGLAGFGAINVSGTTRWPPSATRSASMTTRALQQEQRAIQAVGGPSRSRLISMGVDRGVLSGLVASAALDNELGELGLSVGDEVLLKESPRFQPFRALMATSRDNYRFALDNAGLSEADFEDMRSETARTLLLAPSLAAPAYPRAGRDAHRLHWRAPQHYVRLSESVILTAVEPQRMS